MFVRRLFPLFLILALISVSGLALAGGAPHFEQIASFARSPMTPPRAGIVNHTDGIYFTASEGGNFNCGAIMRVSGTNTSALLHFTGKTGLAKGDAPSGALVSDGTNSFFGVTTRGGVNDAGTVFQFFPSTGTLITLVEFGHFVSGGNYALGRNPTSGLARDGNGMLWGISGGSPAVVYKVDPANGQATNVTTISPTQDAQLGLTPRGELAFDGVDSMWGVTADGGPGGWGRIYKIHQATGAVTLVVSFTGSSGGVQGKFPTGTLVKEGATGNMLGLSSSLTSGITAGNVFRVKISTGSYSQAGTIPYSADFSSVKEGLVDMQNGLFGGMGVSTNGSFGCYFTWNASTTATAVQPFTLATRLARGADPVSVISPSSGILAGCLTGGGPYERGGVCTFGGAFISLAALSASNPEMTTGSVPAGGLIEGAEGRLWGLIRNGGSYFAGSAVGAGGGYAFQPTNDLVSTPAVLIAATTAGRKPVGELLRVNEWPDFQDYFWGQASEGNAGSNTGTAFRFIDNFRVDNPYAQVGLKAELPKLSPNGGLTPAGYGARWSAAGDKLYYLSGSSALFIPAFTFTGTSGQIPGSQPSSRLFRASEILVWGTTEKGGALDHGTIYKVDRIGTGSATFTSVVKFTGAGGNAPGSRPNGPLMAGTPGFLWGTTAEGGAGGLGTVFKLDTVSGALTTVTTFGTGAGMVAGATPKTGLTADGRGYLWGTTAAGGAADRGTIFRIKADTEAFETMFEFTGSALPAPGTGPASPLLLHSDGNLYGTTPGLAQAVGGPPASGGNVFRIRFGQRLDVRQNSIPLVDGVGLPEKGGLAGQIKGVYDVEDNRTLTLQLTNRGTTAITGLSFQITGPQAGDYKVEVSPLATLAPGQTLPFNLIFDPQDIGARNAVLTIGGTSPEADSFVMPLAGTAVKRTIGFEFPTAGVPENGYTESVNVILSAPLNSAVKIPFTVSNDSATSADFSISASPLIIPAGGTVATIRVTGKKDRLVEPFEAFTITLGTPSSSSVVLPPEADKVTCSVQIYDDDTLPAVINLTGGGVMDLGQPIVMSAAADVSIPGAVPFTGNWWHNGKVIPGATQPVYHKTHATLADAGTYQYTIRTQSGIYVSSSPSEVWVIDTKERVLNVTPGKTAVLTLGAAGRGLSYSWRRSYFDFTEPVTNGARISGTTTNTLKIAQASAADEGTYRCFCSVDGYGPVTATNFRLQVTAGAEVKPMPITPEFPEAQVGLPYEYDLPRDFSEGNEATDPSRPTRVAAGGLPPGLVCDPFTGSITGTPLRAGRYKVTVTMSNGKGAATAAAFLEVAGLPEYLPGRYTMLISGTSYLSIGSRLDMTVSASGVVTGVLTTGAHRRSFSSRVYFADSIEQGYCHVELLPPSNSSTEPWWSFNFVLRPDSLLEGDFTIYALTGMESGGLSGWRNVWHAVTQPATSLHPHHNFAVRAGDSNSCLGNGRLALSLNGTTVVSGRLADGSAFATTSFLSPGNACFVYQPLYGTGGLAWTILCQPHGTEADPDLIEPALSGGIWDIPVRPATTRYTRNPLFNRLLNFVSLTGSSYEKPAADEYPLGLEDVPVDENNARFHFDISELIVASPPDVAFRLGKNFQVTLPHAGSVQNPGRVTQVSFDAATGAFSGKFTVDYGTANARSATFHGLMMPGLGVGLGYFIIAGPANPLVYPPVTVRNSPFQPGMVTLEGYVGP